MNVLSIIDKIYESSRFGTFLTISIIILIILFCVVFALGVKDSKKTQKKQEEVPEEVNDITFDIPNELENIKEDVTFEMPSLTQNLENFKKTLEEEIQKEEMAEVRKTSGLILPKEKKTIKVLELDKIEDTSIIPITDEQKEVKVSSTVEKDDVNNISDEITKKKNVLEEKIFSKNKDFEVPIIKAGDSNISSKSEVLHIEDSDKIKGNEDTNVANIREKSTEKDEKLKSNAIRKKVENRTVIQKKEDKVEQSGMYSTEDDF